MYSVTNNYDIRYSDNPMQCVYAVSKCFPKTTPSIQFSHPLIFHFNHCAWEQWVSEYSLTPHLTQYRSFRRRTAGEVSTPPPQKMSLNHLAVSDLAHGNSAFQPYGVGKWVVIHGNRCIHSADDLNGLCRFAGADRRFAACNCRAAADDGCVVVVRARTFWVPMVFEKRLSSLTIISSLVAHTHTCTCCVWYIRYYNIVLKCYRRIGFLRAGPRSFFTGNVVKYLFWPGSLRSWELK